MRLCANWLPRSPELTREVARRAERIGLWGLGIGDSPHYGELYAACADALSVTERLTVISSVTNPVTRHWSVHAGAARTLGDGYGAGRFVLGMGRGDSAVRTFGLAPAPLVVFERALTEIGAAVPAVGLLVAAGGPRTARIAGRRADGLVAGAGADRTAIVNLAGEAAEARTEHGRDGRPQVWASVRLALARDWSEVPELRRRMLPRAISASRFNFAGTFAGKNVPHQYQQTLTERYRAYDFAWHGRSGANPVAGMFADRPDIEDYLLDRFAVIGPVEHCRHRLAELAPAVDGVFCSLLFEDVLDQLDLVGNLTEDLAGIA